MGHLLSGWKQRGRYARASRLTKIAFSGGPAGARTGPSCAIPSGFNVPLSDAKSEELR